MDQESMEQEIVSLKVRVHELERTVSDHAQRFDTLQSPLRYRIRWWLQGWPWHDLNASGPKRRWWKRT